MSKEKTTIFSKQSKIFILSVLCTLFFTTSCKDEKENNEWEINNGNTTITFDGSTFSKEVSVKSNYPWKIVEESASEWIQPIIKENSLILLLAPNSSTHKRTGSIEIKNRDGKIQVLNIEQKPTDVDLKIVSINDKIWLNYHQTEYTFYIYSKTNWTLSYSNSWLTTDISSGAAGSHKITAHFSKNTDKDKRTSTITLSAEAENTTIEVTQRGKKEFDDADYNFFLNNGTLPPLYTGLIIMGDERPAYLIEERGTLNTDKLPSHVTKLSANDFPNNIIDIIRNIEIKNPDAIYSYYVDDPRAHGYLSVFTRLGIDTSRVKLTILPDGSSTYSTKFSSIYGENGKGGDNFRAEQDILKQQFSDYINNPSFGYYDTKKNKATPFGDEIPHVLAQYHHVRYYIEDKSFLISKDDYVMNEMSKSNYVVLPPRELLDELPSNKQDEFYTLVGFDKETNNKLLNASSKPNLIIVGTNTNSASSPQEQAKYVQKVMDRYSSTHDIFYKAHPADKAYLDYETKFLGLKLIKPVVMPFEVFTWAMDSQIDALGGYTSTVFLTVPTDKVQFMFAKDASDLGGEFFYNIFKDRTDIYWIQ